MAPEVGGSSTGPAAVRLGVYDPADQIALELSAAGNFLFEASEVQIN